MNTSYPEPFEDLVSQIAGATTTPGWDKSGDYLASMAAYSAIREQQHMTKTNPIPEADAHVFAGVNACMLAAWALQIKFGEPKSARARLTVAAANNVLRCWGLSLEDIEPEPGNDDAPESAPDWDQSKSDSLIWPPVDRLGRPLSTTLPAVYRENYYHVHEPVMVNNPEDIRVGIIWRPEALLVLHEAYWNEEKLQWRMRFSGPADKSSFWLDHCQVKPGNEIPKPVDVAAPGGL